MILLKIFGAVAGWILCGVVAYILVNLGELKDSPDYDKALCLCMCLTFGPFSLVFIVLVAMATALYNLCLFIVRDKKKEEDND